MPPELNYSKLNGLIPCVIQDNDTDKVLMLGFMNEEALTKTKAEKRITFFSRSKLRLWTKGESSGNFLELVSIHPDCDNDTLLIKAKPRGPVCHTGADTCFQEKNKKNGLGFLEAVIDERKKNPKPGSYTNRLLDSGMNKVAQKVGEEAVELVIEAKDNDREKFLNESADLMYHFLVLLSAKGVTLNEVIGVLKGRHEE
ncbi:MAG TPA: bifunctional phosphoribosyl-AMP cyclohydrolase/phosphoribosyl-ATP diphosphatase HisIE [Cyclobacteriaceae bacterium]|nr:bifunctional phosphoribosyl-AMP cyclohydrolase/phosphoribosyl-ATP diphosphatase HisIE [Cyclobacteriaceae bacterium]